MHDYLSSEKSIFTLFEKNFAKFVSIIKHSSLSLFGFVILYRLNIKKIELVLSETIVQLHYNTKISMWPLNSQFLLLNCLSTGNLFVPEHKVIIIQAISIICFIKKPFRKLFFSWFTISISFCLS